MKLSILLFTSLIFFCKTQNNMFITNLENNREKKMHPSIEIFDQDTVWITKQPIGIKIIITNNKHGKSFEYDDGPVVFTFNLVNLNISEEGIGYIHDSKGNLVMKFLLIGNNKFKVLESIIATKKSNNYNSGDLLIPKNLIFYKN